MANSSNDNTITFSAPAPVDAYYRGRRTQYPIGALLLDAWRRSGLPLGRFVSALGYRNLAGGCRAFDAWLDRINLKHSALPVPEAFADLYDADLSFETYMSLTCHNCPDVVQATHLMAVLNPRIRAVAVDGGLSSTHPFVPRAPKVRGDGA